MARKGSKDRGLFERNGVWWIRYMDGHGQERRERIGAKGLARRVYEKRKTEIREGTYFPPDRRRSVLFDEILEDYREQAQATGRAVLRGESGYHRLGHLFGGKRVDTITPKDVETFRDQLAEETSPATANRHLTLLRAIFRRAIRDEKMGSSPFRAVEFLKENNTRVRYLTPSEEQRLLKALPYLLWPLVVVAIHTGMRKGELLNLRWQDVDFYSKTITIRRAKAGEGRRLPMNDVVRETLMELRKQRIRQGKAKGRELLSPYVFCATHGGHMFNLKREWYHALKQAKIHDLHFHDLRHTFASRLVMAGVDLYRVQTLLGHKTPMMTLRYAHLSPAHLREAVAVLTQKSGAGFGAGSLVNLGVSK